ncbi:MAG: hypothetical protein E4H36_09905, partial [Spirochaetales bacterium]
MDSNTFTITEETFKDGYKGQALLINLSEIRREYKYLALWYARDKQEKTSINTKVYYGSGGPIRPPEPGEEIKEAQFKIRKRLAIDLRYDYAWAAFQVNDTAYADLKIFETKTEQAYIPYQVVHTRGHGFEVLGSGTFKGSQAKFFQLGVEDNKSAKDYMDIILFAVMIETFPPADWYFDDTCIGVQRLPVMVSQFRFNDSQRYSPWCGNKP